MRPCPPSVVKGKASKSTGLLAVSVSRTPPNGVEVSRPLGRVSAVTRIGGAGFQCQETAVHCSTLLRHASGGV